LCYTAAVTIEQILGFSLAMLVMLVALIGTIVPALPGTPIALAAAVAHRVYFGAASVNNTVLVVLVLLMLLSLLFEFLASVLGAKKFGATWRGAVGAVIGGVIGMFFSLPGLILGPFVGATLCEMIGRQEFRKAAKAGTGAVLGLLLGIVGKVSICVIMIGLFATNVIFRSGS
jgi:uncharacterized protein YqgC (DUF456 family)